MQTHKYSKTNQVEENVEIKPAYLLKLYITGASPNSIKAVNNIKLVCEKYLKHRYSLEIIDIYQEPQVAKKEQLVALPLLVKHFPLPVRQLIGNMSNINKLLEGLDLTEAENTF